MGMMSEQQKQIREQLDERIKAVTAAIVKALVAKGHKVGYDGLSADASDSARIVDGVSTGFAMNYEYTGGEWNPRYSGKLRMKMGSLTTKNYPEPKAGFDIEKAVERIEAIVDRALDGQARMAKKDALEKQGREFFLDSCKALGVTEVSEWQMEARHRGAILRAGTGERVYVQMQMNAKQLKAFLALLEVCDE